MTKRHAHRLKRHIYKTGNAIYFCTLPDCHFKIECQLMLGKRAMCNVCGNEFIINEYQTKLARPHCDKCSKVRVRGADGKRHFVRQDSMPIMAQLAEASVEGLRSRLNNVLETSEDEDI
jgi:hypothetical protein